MKLGFNLEHSVPILNYTISRVLKIPFTKPRLQVIVLHIFHTCISPKLFFSFCGLALKRQCSKTKTAMTVVLFHEFLCCS